MPQSFKYPQSILLLSDYIIGSDSSQENVTQNFKVNEVVATMLHALGIGTVKSISTASSDFIDTTGGIITNQGTISMALSATGLGATTAIKETQYLRGDGTWDITGAVAASTLKIQFNGLTLTDNVSSINFTGNSDATAADFNVAVDMPGVQDTLDSVVAGTAISINPTTGTGVVQIANNGAILAKAGGFITLSGGTGAVTVNTTKNAGTVTLVNQGIGIDLITNNTSNAGISVDYTGINNYIDVSEVIVPITEVDVVIYNQISSSNVKTTRIGVIDQSDLVLTKKDIDDNDAGSIKNSTDNNYEVSRTKNMVSCTSAEYNQLVVAGTTDQNTLYFVVSSGPAPEFTVIPSIVNNAGGVLGQDYNLIVSPSSVTNIVGTEYTFTVTLVLIGSFPRGTFSGENPQSFTDVIVGNLGSTYEKSLVFNGTYTPPALPVYISKLSISLLGSISANQHSDWQFKAAPNSQPGDESNNGIATNTGDFFYNPIVELINTNKHKFVTGEPKYQTEYDPIAIADESITPTLVSEPDYTSLGNFTGSRITQEAQGRQWFTGIFMDQNQTIQADYYLIQYSAALTVDVSNVTISGAGHGTPQYDWSIISSPVTNNQEAVINQNGGIIAEAITNLNDGSEFSWIDPAEPNLDPGYSWGSTPTYVFNPTGPQTISGGNNGSATLTITGAIIFTPPVAGQITFTLDSDAVQYSNGANSSDWSVCPSNNSSSGQAAKFAAYQVGPTGLPCNLSPLAPGPYINTRHYQYTWSSGPTLTMLAGDPPFMARTEAQGGMPYGDYPTIHYAEYKLTGTLVGPPTISFNTNVELVASPIVNTYHSPGTFTRTVAYEVTYQWGDSIENQYNEVVQVISAPAEDGPSQLTNSTTYGDMPTYNENPNKGKVKVLVNRISGGTVGASNLVPFGGRVVVEFSSNNVLLDTVTVEQGQSVYDSAQYAYDNIVENVNPAYPLIQVKITETIFTAGKLIATLLRCGNANIPLKPDGSPGEFSITFQGGFISETYNWDYSPTANQDKQSFTFIGPFSLSETGMITAKPNISNVSISEHHARWFTFNIQNNTRTMPGTGLPTPIETMSANCTSNFNSCWEVAGDPRFTLDICQPIYDTQPEFTCNDPSNAGDVYEATFVWRDCDTQTGCVCGSLGNNGSVTTCGC